MKPIISQKLINVLKNKIFNVISLNLFNNVEFLLNNLLNNNTPNQYFNVIFKAQQTARDIVKSIVISTFEELDNEFKESTYRKSRYYINKSNVPRTLITIVGEITFYRTYYISKHSNKKFFYIDKIFDLPKNDHYDPIVKAISISKAVSTSQAQSVRDTSAFINDISYFETTSTIKDIPRQSVYNWIKNWYIPNIVPKSVETPETLYVMADEKYIGAQNISKDIMIKCFVTFEDIKDISKNRRQLVNRSVFSCCTSKAWPKFMDFIDAVNTIILNNPKRKNTITKKLKYIINNYTNIKSMLNLNIGSSMESHISHLIASFFSSRPKGFSTKRIEKYIKLNDYKYNNINIFKLYLSTYSKKQTITLNENTYDYEIFSQDKLHNIPVLNNGLKTGTYTILNNISHDISINYDIKNET